MTNKKILHYQELATNAWPAETHIFLHGWVVRVSEGVTKRANSVLPLRYTGEDLLKDIQTVEKIYRKRNLPVIFQLPDYFEPENLKKTLLSREYTSVAESLVMTAKIEDIHPLVSNKYTYSIEHTGSDRWFQALQDFSHYSPKTLKGQKAIIERIFFSKAFCCAQQANEIVGIGLGVIQQKYLGIYSLAVHPGYRRKGIGQSIVTQMVHWGKLHSVTHVYLQVQGDNTEAISFYNKIGFKELYHYRYLIK